ncbi:MAG: Carbohydrate-selective porin OprB, partial [Nevskia sp.]|nr:Carbohydrate-selective porin OprB [Nevskia sp.]
MPTGRIRHERRNIAAVFCGVVFGAAHMACIAADDAPAPPERWSLHWQATNVTQYHPGFRSPYSGANSLSGESHDDETTDATLFAGVRLWRGMGFYLNPEVDQGYGLSDTLGLAGFSSG